MSDPGATKRILAVSSGGGHWEQLMLLSPSFADADIRYVTTLPGLPEKSKILNFEIISDCNRNRPLSVLFCIFQAAVILLRFRPHLVVSTGAAPGLICLGIGKLLGARTIWVDSVANGQRLSMSGKLAGRFCDLQLTQWAHLATPAGPRYLGSVL